MARAESWSRMTRIFSGLAKNGMKISTRGLTGSLINALGKVSSPAPWTRTETISHEFLVHEIYLRGPSTRSVVLAAIISVPPSPRPPPKRQPTGQSLT